MLFRVAICSAFYKNNVQHRIYRVRKTEAFIEGPGTFARADDSPALRRQRVELFFCVRRSHLQNRIVHGSSSFFFLHFITIIIVIQVNPQEKLYTFVVGTKFADNLRALRAEKKLSQGKLAQVIGVTQQCVSEWENRKTEPTMTYLWMLADFFGVSMDVLCGREEW